MACGGGVRCRVAVCLAPHSTAYYSTKDGAGVRTAKHLKFDSLVSDK